MPLVEFIWFRSVEGSFLHTDGIKINGVILVDPIPPTRFVQERMPVVFATWYVTSVDDNPSVMT